MSAPPSRRAAEPPSRRAAAAYNAAHSLLGSLALLAAAAELALAAAALGWLAHVGADRALGYGLKYPSAFADAHLGRLGAGSR